MAKYRFLLLSLIAAFSTHLVSASVSENHCVEDLQRIKLKIVILETKIGDILRSIDEKGIYIEDQDNLIHQMSQKIMILQSSVLDLKTDSLSGNEKLNALEQEVQLLWASLRRNNFDIHVLKSKAQEAEKKLETVSSQAEKVSNIVTEQWIQLQRLEQALHMTQMMTLRVRGRVDYSKCPIFRFISKLSGGWLQQLRKILDPYIVHFKRCFTQTKDYHHQLQRFIKRELEKNEYTSALANEELVFFVASALITFPILGAWMFLSSQLR